MSAPTATHQVIQKDLLKIKSQIKKVIKGKDQVIDQILISLLCGGHVLIEDLPGMGKTTLAYALAKSLNADFNRIQFTSDLLPADVLGVSIYDEESKQFQFKQGPVFCNILLADEINRTTPKTQSALLEVMDRGKVSIDGVSHIAGEPFMVLATQNPVDFEGTFPLPDSQMDRFLIRLEMGYPAFDDELEILQRGMMSYDQIDFDAILDPNTIIEYQKSVHSVFVEDSVLDYLLRLVQATRSESAFRNGVSPRGSLALKVSAQARALYYGRNFVMPEDIEMQFVPVTAHRLSLKQSGSDPIETNKAIIGILKTIIDRVDQPID